jgi:hypothetical protein
MAELYYGITSFILGLALFFPLRKFMLASSANRFARKEKRQPTDEEMAALRKRTTILAAVIAITFAFFYNKFIMMKFFGTAGTGGAQ